MKRTVIKIDDNLCNGCGNCVVGCREGALQIINGKAVMISDLYCDGLGACIGECPVGAISFEEREAVPYDEAAVMERLALKGESAILAHLKHLKDHNEHEWVRQGIEYIREHNIKADFGKIGISSGEGHEKPTANTNTNTNNTAAADKPMACGCPGSMSRKIRRPQPVFRQAELPPNHNGGQTIPVHTAPNRGHSYAMRYANNTNAQSTATTTSAVQASELRQFPVQLRLINPQASFLHGADLLLAADCTAFACGDFHRSFLRGKSLVIACPKLDSDTQLYVDKLAEMIDKAKINTLTVLVMEVPCCSGLVRIAQLAREKAERNIPIKVIVLSVEGETKDDKWI